MKSKVNWAAAILIATVLSNAVFAIQTVRLNTGYNHALSVDAPYSPTTQDNYWIRIGSGFPALSPAVAPAWAINRPAGSVWLPPFPNSTWINAANSSASLAGVNQNNPGYQVYRKCFCLQKGFNKANMRFQVRADDSVAIFFNNYGNQILPTSAGNWGSGNPYFVNVDQGFKVGRNCIYVLVGDVGSYAGFNLEGTVSANGLLPTPSFGISGNQNQGTFEPCGCESGPAGLMKNSEENDSEIAEKILESARKGKIKEILR